MYEVSNLFSGWFRRILKKMTVRAAIDPSASTQMVTGPGTPCRSAAAASRSRTLLMVIRRHFCIDTCSNRAAATRSPPVKAAAPLPNHMPTPEVVPPPDSAAPPTATAKSDGDLGAWTAASGRELATAHAALFVCPRATRTWSARTFTSPPSVVRPRTKLRPDSESRPKP